MALIRTGSGNGSAKYANLIWREGADYVGAYSDGSNHGTKPGFQNPITLSFATIGTNDITITEAGNYLIQQYKQGSGEVADTIAYKNVNDVITRLTGPTGDLIYLGVTKLD